VDETAPTVRVPTDGTAGAVLRTLTALSAAGLPAARVDLHAPTLDEVFLHLTETTAATTLERTA
jgi:ABC-2 type transport system ATP-binding protein